MTGGLVFGFAARLIAALAITVAIPDGGTADGRPPDAGAALTRKMKRKPLMILPPKPLDRSLPRPESCPTGMRAVAGQVTWRWALMATEYAWTDLRSWVLDRSTVPGFCMDTLEVTVGDFRACVKAGACERPARPGNYGKKGRDRNPIDCVSEEQAERYCTWKGKRLPTAEDIGLAQKGMKLYADFPSPDDPHWSEPGFCCGRSRRKGTCEIGSSREDVTPDGILDLEANAREWCSGDCSFGTRATQPCDTRLWRGGNPNECNGFRCVWPAESKEVLDETVMQGASFVGPDGGIPDGGFPDRPLP